MHDTLPTCSAAGERQTTAGGRPPKSVRVLYWAYLDTHFREMIRVARMLRREAGYEPFFVFAADYPQILRDIKTCDAEGIGFLRFRAKFDPAARLLAAGPAKGKRPFLQRAWRYSNFKFWGAVGRAKRYLGFALAAEIIRIFRLELWMARKCVRFVRPDLMVFPEDNVEYCTGAFIKAGHELGVRSLVIPYTICTSEEPAEAYYSHDLYQVSKWSNRLTAAIYPQWRLDYKGRSLVRLPAAGILIRHWLNLAPPAPWVWNSGAADRILVESRATFDYFAASGLDSTRMQIVGSLRMDELASHLKSADALRRELLAKFGLSDQRRLFVCAFPPDQGVRAECEFHDYKQLCDAWIAALSDIPNSNVLVVPHPRMPQAQVDYLRTSGLHVLEDDITRCIAVADVYVASVSATIVLAVAAGKPVINYDVYRYNYSDYKKLKGVLDVDDVGSFRRVLKSLATDDVKLEKVRSQQVVLMDAWGSLDGSCSRRLLEQVNELLEVGPCEACKHTDQERLRVA